MKGLRDACPQGIDIYFDNVGGDILDAALARLARGMYSLFTMVLCQVLARLARGMYSLSTGFQICAVAEILYEALARQVRSVHPNRPDVLIDMFWPRSFVRFGQRSAEYQSTIAYQLDVHIFLQSGR